MSENQLSKELGMPQSTLNRQLRDGTLSAQTVADAARVLDADVMWLLTGEGAREGTAGGATRDGAGERDPWSDPFMEMMVRESRAAEKRSEAALTWARWLDKEAGASVERHADLRRRDATAAREAMEAIALTESATAPDQETDEKGEEGKRA